MTAEMVLALQALNKNALVNERAFQKHTLQDATMAAAFALPGQIDIQGVERHDVKFRAVNITNVEPSKCSNPLKKGYMIRGRDMASNATLVAWIYLLAEESAPEIGTQKLIPAIHIPKGRCAMVGLNYVTNAAGVAEATSFYLLEALGNHSYTGAPKAMCEEISAEACAAMVFNEHKTIAAEKAALPKVI